MKCKQTLFICMHAGQGYDFRFRRSILKETFSDSIRALTDEQRVQSTQQQTHVQRSIHKVSICYRDHIFRASRGINRSYYKSIYASTPIAQVRELSKLLDGMGLNTHLKVEV